MDALRKRDDGTLHLGILATGTHILPPLLAEFRRRSPGIAVHMAVLHREELSRRMLDGDVDLALMGRGPESATAGTAGEDLLTREPFASNPHVIIAGQPPPPGAGIAPIELRHEASAARGRFRHARDAGRVPEHAPHRPTRADDGERQRNGQARRDVAAGYQPHIDAYAVPRTRDRRTAAPRRRSHAHRGPVRRTPSPALAAAQPPPRSGYLLDEGA
jgi:DNA-binding transcriptional LysR family regulator